MDASETSELKKKRGAEFYTRAFYWAFLNREPDADGMNYWSTRLEKSPELLAVLSNFIDSPEYGSAEIGDPGLTESVRRLDLLRDEVSSNDVFGDIGPLNKLQLADATAIGNEFRSKGRRPARFLRRIGWRLLAPLVEKIMKTQDQQLALLLQAQNHRTSLLAETLNRNATLLANAHDRSMMLLSAWIAHASYDKRAIAELRAEIASTLLARQSVNDRVIKEQMAMASRLLSVEEKLIQNSTYNINPQPKLKQSSEVVSQPSVNILPLEDVKLNLSTGPYGRYLTIVPDLIGGVVESGKFWDPHLETIIEKYADQGRDAIDAGAYIGFHSVFLSRHFNRVYSFEPQPKCFRLLNANLAFNGCDRVVTHNLALYDSVCEMELASEELQQIPLSMRDGTVNYSEIGNAAALAFMPSSSAGTMKVQATTIDCLQLDNVGFIKVDTQGSDLRVLCGARGTIERCRPVIVFEFEAELALHHGDTKETFQTFFAERNYGLREIAHNGDQQWDFLATPNEISFS